MDLKWLTPDSAVMLSISLLEEPLVFSNSLLSFDSTSSSESMSIEESSSLLSAIILRRLLSGSRDILAELDFLLEMTLGDRRTISLMTWVAVFLALEDLSDVILVRGISRIFLLH